MLDVLIMTLTVSYKYILMDTKSNYPALYYAILAAIVALCIVKIYGRMSSRTMPSVGDFKASVLVVFFFVAFLTVLSKDANFILPFLITAAFAYDRVESLIRAFFIGSVVSYLVHLVLFWSGVLTDNALYRIEGSGEILMRSSLGFDHPNSAFRFFVPIVLAAYLLCHTHAEKLALYVFSLLSMAYLYRTSNTRTGAALVCGFLLLSLLDVRKLQKHKVILRLTRYGYFILAAFSLFLAYGAGRDPYHPVTLLLTGRPYIWHSYLTWTGVPLLGAGGVPPLPEEFVLAQYGQSVDNYFVYLLLGFGWICFVLLGLLYSRMFRKMEQAGRMELIFVSAVMLLYGLTEEANMIPSTNFSLVFLFAPFFNANYFQRDGETASAFAPAAFPIGRHAPAFGGETNCSVAEK